METHLNPDFTSRVIKHTLKRLSSATEVDIKYLSIDRSPFLSIERSPFKKWIAQHQIFVINGSAYNFLLKFSVPKQNLPCQGAGDFTSAKFF